MCSHFMCWVPEERAKSDADIVCAPFRQTYQKDFKICNILKEFFFKVPIDIIYSVCVEVAFHVLCFWIDKFLEFFL